MEEMEYWIYEHSGKENWEGVFLVNWSSITNENNILPNNIITWNL